ncbi:MAG: glycosyltransferase family 2 protein [Arenicellales bacterium]
MLTEKCTLGVVAISFNEERDLPGFLENLYDWVDEIVIVDDGSTDKTHEIAEGWGGKVKFIRSPRHEGEYFSHQRNKGIDVAESDWLLHMDIDERVPLKLSVEILEAIKSIQFDAYRYRRLNFFLHRPMKGGGWQDWNLVHLAKRDIFRFDGMYHEDCLVEAPAERIGQMNEKMWHLNDDTYMERMTKSNLYCQEQSKIFSERGLSVRWWHFFSLPILEFGNKYVRKKGFRDGTIGILFALHSSCATFRACALLWDEQNNIPRSSVDEKVRQLWINDNK